MWAVFGEGVAVVIIITASWSRPSGVPGDFILSMFLRNLYALSFDRLGVLVLLLRVGRGVGATTGGGVF